MSEIADAIHDRPTWERITRQAREDVALNPRYSFRAMVEAMDSALALAAGTSERVHPGGFEQLASRSYARLRTTQLHAFGLSPGINRVRIMAGRVVRGLSPSAIAIGIAPRPAYKWAEELRERWRYMRSLTFWAARPHLLPSSLLFRYRSALLRDLSELARLQVTGGRAQAMGAGGLFAVIVDESARDLRVVLRRDKPTAAHRLPALPGDLSWASSVTLGLTDPWLVPGGVRGSPPRKLEALSAVLRSRPDVGRRLLAGEKPWCDVVGLHR